MTWAALRYSARSFARTPALTFVLLLTIALGVGANASVFGFIRGSVGRPLQLADGHAIVSVFARSSDGSLRPTSYKEYVSLKAQPDVFRSLGAARESQSSVGLGVGGRTSIMSIAAVTPELADLLDLPLNDGVVISHRVWRPEFGSWPMRGERLHINGADARIAGVAPEWLEGLFVGRAIDIWMPMREAAFHGFNRSSRTLWLLGRLSSGMSPHHAQAAANSSRNDADVIVVLPYTGMTPDVASGILLIGRLLPAAAGVVFLIACANVAGLLLSRASARSHETSIRIALGASRRDLGRQLLCDSVLVSVAGGAFASLLAFWTAPTIPAFLFDQDAERLALTPDLTAIMMASAVGAGITIACGLMPMLEIRHDDPARVLQRESAGPSPKLRRVRAGLVVMQMTCCCLLVISTVQLFEAFQSALRTSTGHRVGRPILATVQAHAGFDRSDLSLEYFHDAERAVQSLPGVSATAWTGTLPGSQPVWYDMRIELPRPLFQEVMLDVVTFTPPSRAPFVLPPIAGRMFGGGDTPESCRVVIVNQDAAEQLFGGDAVGRFLEESTGERAEIIGVVAARQAAGTRRRNRPTIYYYGGQTGTAPDRTGSAVFRVPRIPNSPSAILAANIVSASYFDAMGMSLTAGRVFSKDSGSAGCRVGIVNQHAAELYFGGDAVGGAVIDSGGRRTQIIGIVRSAVLRASQRSEPPAIYFPIGQDFRPRMTLILGARTAPEALLTSVRQQLKTVSGGDPGGIAVTTLDAHLSRTGLASERIAVLLVGACAATALALGILGLYGALGDAARHRGREIALRLALGARRWSIMRQLLVEGVRLASAGTVAGMIGSLVVARWLTVTTPSVGSLSAWVWLAVPGVLLAVVATASVLPVRRALTVNPVSLLRGN